MAQTTYTYSIAVDVTSGAVRPGQLSKEIATSSIVIAVERIDVTGDVLDVVMKDAISAGDKTTLDGLVQAHVITDPLDEPRESDGTPIVRPRAFVSSDGYRFRGTGISGTITAGTEGSVDYKLTEDRMINAVHLMLENHVWADSVKFQIVDIDNILGYGPNTVLDEFATAWNVDPSICSQRHERIEYPAKVLKDLYIRIKYTSTGGTDVNMHINLYLHKVPV